MRPIVLTLAVLLASFWLTAPAFGQCANGVCRRPVAKALAAPVRAVAAAPRVIAAAPRAVVYGGVAALRGTAKIVSLPIKAVKQCACNAQQRRCDRGPIFPRLHARRCH